MKQSNQTMMVTIKETYSKFTLPLLIGCGTMAVVGFNLIGECQAVLNELCYLLAHQA